VIDSELNIDTIALQIEPEVSYVPTIQPFKTVVCVLLSDALAVILSLAAAAAFRDYLIHSPSPPIAKAMLPAVLLVLCSIVAAGLYPGVGVNPVEEIRKTTISITLAFLSLWSLTFFLHDLAQSRLVYALAYALAVVGVPAFRAVTRALLSKKEWWGSNVAILGYGDVGKILFEKLRSNPSIGLKPIAVLDDDEDALAGLGGAVVSGPLHHCLEITRENRISYGIVCMSGLSRGELLDLLDRYGKCFSHLMVIPDLIGMTSLGISAREVGGIVGLELTQQLLRPSAQFIKRVLDLSLTLVAAPAVLPLVALSGVLIKLEDGGPVFYSDERVGRRGRPFRALKLRSMVLNGEQVLERYLEENPAEKLAWDTCQKLKHDPRVTRIGRLLRKTSIDEMPQFWNVLMGDMSLVGPRPMFRHQIAMYGKGFHLYKQVRPGITGLWQVSGRNQLSFTDRAHLDRYLIRNWSVWLDVYILFRTIAVVLTGRGAY
jgi:Undecaprenyl-phosphate galactose phosphotransferase WbaP